MPTIYRRHRRPFATVEAWMKSTGTSRRQLAKVLSISESHLCNVLTRKRPPSYDLAHAISELTNVPIETIRQPKKIA